MSDDEKLLVEVCMNCKNYICGLCLHLDHWVEDDDWCGAWERLEQRWKAMRTCDWPRYVRTLDLRLAGRG
jgi:hypothetical protein